MTPEWLSKALCTLQVAKEQCWHREQSWTRSNCLCVLQEAEEPQALRSIGIDPAAFIAEVHLDGRHAEAVACCYLYGNSGGKCFEAKQHANVESIMHMPDCSCDLCFCLSQHRFCIVLGQAKHQSPCENRLAQSSSPRVWLALCCTPPPPSPPWLCCIAAASTLFPAQVWDGTWVKWTGQIPSDMSPLSSVAALNDHLHSAESAEYKPTPLDEPSEGLGRFIRQFVHTKISDDDPSARLTGNQDIVR